MDTNVVVSAFLWSGSPSVLLLAAEESKIELFTTVELLTELERILFREKFMRRLAASPLSRTQLVERYSGLASIATATRIPPTCVDPNDDMVLAAAKSAHAQLIVSGDQHLLSIRSFEGVQILTVKEALAVTGLVA